jgi:hypothetical protein
VSKAAAYLVGDEIRCGRCDVDVTWRVRHGSVCAPPVWQLNGDVWRMSRRGLKQLRSGRRPEMRRKVWVAPEGIWHRVGQERDVPGSRLEPAPWSFVQPPATLRCPLCDALNRLEAGSQG